MGPDNPPRRGQSRFVSNTAALGVSTAITAVLTLVQIKILSTFLAPDVFGTFAALRGLSLLVAMLAANGFPQLLIRFLPQHESGKQQGRALVLSGASFLAPLFLLTVFVFVIEANRSFFFDFMPPEWTNGIVGGGGLFLWFYTCTLGVTLKLLLYGGLNGLRRLPLQVALELTALVVQVLWIFLWRDQLTLARLFAILGVTSLAPCIVGIPWYFVHLARDTSPSAKSDTPVAGDRINAYASYWSGAVGLSLVAVAFTDVDRYVLSRVLVLEVLSQFHIGSRVMRMANRFLSVPVLAFQPEITRLDAEKRDASVKTSTIVFFKFNTAVAVAVAMGIWVFAPEIVRLISSARYDAAVPLLKILVLSIPLTAMTAPLTAVMKARDEVRQALYCDLAWAVTYICLLVGLGGAFGLVGAGIALVTASMVQLFLAAGLSRERPDIKAMGTTAGKIGLSGVAAFVPLFAAGVLVTQFTPVGILIKIVLFIVAPVLFRIVIRKTRVFDEQERGVLIALLDRRGLGAVARRIV